MVNSQIKSRLQAGFSRKLNLQAEKHEVGGNQCYKIKVQVIHVEELSVGVSNGKQVTPIVSSEVHKKCILVHF